jgi:NAD(P)-dependent dehydrogenase (short-subunit alcohol dehydrogenase family)
MITLVTGGGRGIGRSIALALSRAGWSVAVTSRSRNELEETASAPQNRMLTVPADITNPAEVHAMTERVEKDLGPVDLLVNNAGMAGPLGPFWENDPAEWWRNQEVNLRGPMLCCREILPGMIARRTGRIVNVASGAGCRSFPEMSAYVVSKTGLIRFSEQLALELSRHGVSVFSIHPGTVRTRMVDESRARLAYIQAILDRGQDVTPDAAADLVLKLASGCADSLSGRMFSVTENVDEIVSRADEIRSRELYLLRRNTLH